MSDLISPQAQEYLTKVISEIFVKYDAQVDKKEIDTFCADFVQQRDKIQEPSSVIGAVNLGLNTIDSLESYHQNLTNAQQKGQSKVNWLKTNLKTITRIDDVKRIGEIVQSIQAELIKSNNKNLTSLSDEEVEVFPEISAKEITERSEETEAVQNLLGEVQNNSLLTTISYAQQSDSVVEDLDTNNQNVSVVAQNCFQGELGNNSELVAKKLVTCGLIVAKNEFSIPIQALDGMNAPQIAIVVDMGVTMAKLAYKVSQGEMRVNKAMEYMYDRSIASICVITQTVIQLEGQFVGAEVGALIGSTFGPAGTIIGALGGTLIGRFAGKTIAQGINVGTVKIGQFAKQSFVQAVNQAQKLTNKAKKAVTNWLR